MKAFKEIQQAMEVIDTNFNAMVLNGTTIKQKTNHLQVFEA